MKPSNQKKSNSTNNGKQKIASPSSHHFLNDALWLCSLAMVVFIILSLLSFSMSDPAWTRSTANTTETKNIIGILGAYLSDILYYIAGLSIWWLPIAAIIWLIKSFGSEKENGQTYQPAWGSLGLFLLLISSSIIEYSLWNQQLINSLPMSAGGFIGQLITPYFALLLGTSGSLLLSFAFILIGLSLLLQLSWLTLIEKMGCQIEFIWKKITRQSSDSPSNEGEKRTSRRMLSKVNKLANQETTTLETARTNRKPTPQKAVIETAQQQSLNFDEGNPEIKHNTNSVSVLPGLNLLRQASTQSVAPIDPSKLQNNAEQIEAKLAEFGIEVKVVSATTGPVITRYEIELAQGIKGSQIMNLSKDLARSLSLQSIRVVETIAGKKTMGIELPNEHRQDVLLNEILSANIFQNASSKLTIALGKDIAGKPVVADLAKMPHLLVAGTTGSGKSVAVNAMIASILYKATPEEVRMIMIDPKMLELSVYQDIPHLLAPVVTDMQQAAQALDWCVNEMEKRYHLLAHTDVRNISSFNEKIHATKKANKTIPNPFSPNPDEPEALETMPYIVVIIDELADLMMVVGKKVEQQIARLAQKARAAGIHLILATQRPSVDVITGLIKANIPTRISFQVSSKIDSRTILDQMGAEHLLGKGDMLFLPPGSGNPTRLHGAFLSDTEVLEIAGYLKRHAPPQYIEGLLESTNANNPNNPSGSQNSEDKLFDQAVQFVLESRKSSISSLQRQLRIGYNRAANLMQDMENTGIVSSPDATGNRHILARNDQSDE